MAKQQKEAAKKAAKKTPAKKAAKKSILVISANDRTEARRALDQHFKINGLNAQERNELRRKQAASFKANKA